MCGRVEVLESRMDTMMKRNARPPSLQVQPRNILYVSVFRLFLSPAKQNPSPHISPTVAWGGRPHSVTLAVTAPKLDLSLRKGRRGQLRESPYAPSRRPSDRCPISPIIL